MLVGGGLLLVAALAYVGLQIAPKPFPKFRATEPELKTMPIPAGLPAPVERYYRITMDGRIPVIRSAVITGRGTLRLGPVCFPARWRFTHEAGRNYRHYIEATLFGRPLLRVNEHYLDGHARFQLPIGVTENEPKLDMSANLALWGESIFFPSIFLTDDRVKWEPVDDSHAQLIVPFGSSTDIFSVSFDPATGLLKSIEALRWKEVTSTAKIPWRVDVTGWDRWAGILLPSKFAIVWEGDPGPWYMADVEEIVYNAEVSDYIRAVGE